MRYFYLIAAAGTLVACSSGTGNYNGVPLDAGDTATCTSDGVPITSSNESARQDLIRCAPQTQPLTGG